MRSTKRLSLSSVFVFVMLVASFMGGSFALATTPSIDLHLEGLDSLDSGLPLVGSSTVADGTVLPGIVTRDLRAGTAAVAEPELVTDASGNISGIVRVNITRGGEVIDSVEIPATGRQRTVVRANIKVLQSPGQSRGESLAEFIALQRSAIAIRALIRTNRLLEYAFVLRINQLILENQSGIIQGAPEYKGEVAMFARNLHYARARLILDAMFFQTVEFFALANGSEGNVLARRYAAQGLVLSDTLGVLSGGSVIMRYVFANLERLIPGRINVRGQVDLFRWAVTGYLFMTAIQASQPGVTIQNVADRMLAANEAYSTPAVLTVFLIQYDQELLRQILIDEVFPQLPESSSILQN